MDAVCKAIDHVVKMDVELTEFAVTAVTEGIDALGEVTIRIEKDGSVYSGPRHSFTPLGPCRIEVTPC